MVRGNRKKLSEKSIRFITCEVAMKNMNVENSMLLNSAGMVHPGLIEIVNKMEEDGWLESHQTRSLTRPHFSFRKKE